MISRRWREPRHPGALAAGGAGAALSAQNAAGSGHRQGRANVVRRSRKQRFAERDPLGGTAA
ncbi:MAG: hypothetical protein DBY37_14555 [Desulfovibrionaceae bacterium]|nr:MAG: hypothetical protein DBY37_14555 [Desulfovibrionaceae bacterium]